MEQANIEVTGKHEGKLEGKVEDKISIAAHKAQLVRRGELYRIGVVRAKAQVLYEAQPQALFRNAVDHATMAVRTSVDNLLTPTGLSMGALLPYAMPLLRMLRKHQFGTKSKVALGALAVLGGVGVYSQQKRKRDAGY